MTEYMTMIVRWRRAPQHHINFPKAGGGGDYMSRWTREENGTQHLTVICAHLSTCNVQTHMDKLLTTMRKLWADPMLNLVTAEALEVMMTEDQPSVALFNLYNVTHTTIQPRVSFYDHIKKIEAMVKEYKWTQSEDQTVANDEMMYKLSCRHEPHSLVVLTSEKFTEMITVQCTEPQTVYSLMRTHGLHCSEVWNSEVSLSASCPCTALRDHMMNIVYVNTIPWNTETPFASTSQISTFYHNMKHVKILARRKALRYKPYIQHSHNRRATTWLEGDESTEDLVTVVLYYDDGMSKLSSVIEADGRFVPSYTIEGNCSEYVVEVERNNEIILTDPTCAEGEKDSETEEADHPFACHCCHSSVYFMSRGH